MSPTATAARAAKSGDIRLEFSSKFPEFGYSYQESADGIPTVWVQSGRLKDVLRWLKNDVPRPYRMLYDLTAIDERLRVNRQGQPDSDFTVVYHLLSFERNSDFRVKVALKGEHPSLPSIVDVWPAANWYEREVWDLFGVKFDGHPNPFRIMMPRSWVGHPLRKDHPARGTEFERFHMDELKADRLQEDLKINPDDWGFETHGRDHDYMLLNLGPNHPSVHGVFRIMLQLDGEEIVHSVPDIGYHHRGAEKMGERQSWHTYIPYTDRIDYLGGVMNNLPYLMAVEKMAGIEVPARAQTIRVMLCEFFRIMSHLLYYGTYVQDVGSMSPVFFAFVDRQKAYDVIEAITGFRMHPAWFRIGGVAADLP
ncbi:MAG: NADH-quinone oxidoreductase subunit C, partial [Nevskiaceae bacterium]